MENTSVYDLLTKLWNALLKSDKEFCKLRRKDQDALVKDLRTVSYKILLKKSGLSLKLESWKESMTPATRLSCHSLNLRLAHKNHQSKKLEELAQNILNNQNMKNQTFESSLKFLVNYADLLRTTALPDETYADVSHKHYWREGEKGQDGIRRYREFSPQIFDSSILDHVVEQELSTRSSSRSWNQNRTDGFPFTAEPGTDGSLLTKFSHSDGGTKRSMISARQSEFSEGSNMFNIPELTQPRDLKFPKHASVFDQLGDEGYETPSFGDTSPDITSECSESNTEQEDDIWEEACKNRNKPFHRTWESRGTYTVVKEKPFLSEAPMEVVYHMRVCCPNVEDTYVRLFYISRESLIRNVKYMLLGMETEIFNYNTELDRFEVKNGLCVKGCSPSAISSYCEDLVECGSLCRKLYDLASGKKDQKWDGFRDCLIRKALCKGLQNFLLGYYHGVMNLPKGPSLIGFLTGCGRYQAQMKSLCHMLGIDRKNGRVPYSFDLLEHLYIQLWKNTDPDMVYVYASILKSCCDVYYKFLQKWIFEGVCDDVYDEFFIRTRPELEGSMSRRYWSKGFVLAVTSVPKFLRGLETSIFECGKALNLLKLCNPKDPLCKVLEGGYPTVSCCLTAAELSRLEESCDEYYRRARLACGEVMSTKDLCESNQEEERLFLEAVQQVQEQRMKDILLKQQEKAFKAFKEKRARLAELKAQMDLAVARKEEERQRQIEDDARMVEEGKKMDEEEAKLREEERQKIIQHYEMLSAAADLRRSQTEERMRLLQDDRRNFDNIANEIIDIVDNHNMEQFLNIRNTEHLTNTRFTSTATTPNGNNPLQDFNSNVISATAGTTTTSEQDSVNGNSDSDIVNANITNHSSRDYSNQGNLAPARARPESDLERNRRRVMSEEYGLVLPVSKKRNFEVYKKSTVETSETSHSDSVNSPDPNIQTLHVKVGAASSEESLHTKDSEDYFVALSDVGGEVEDGLQSIATPSQDDPSSGIIRIHERAYAETEISSEEDFSSCVSIPALLEKDETSSKVVPNAKKPIPIMFRVNTVSSFSFMKLYEEYEGKLFDTASATTDIANSVIRQKTLADSEIEELKNFSIPFALAALRKSVLVPLQIQAKLVNEQILKHFLASEDLLSHLNSLRSYFFLLDGEFGRNMTHELFQSTYKVSSPAALLNFATLNSILARALSNSISSAGKNGSRLSFSVQSVPKEFKHSSVDVLGCLSLQYKVSWPLNIIITEEALEKYNQVFGFLLKLRRISWILEEDFQWLKGFGRDSQSAQCHKVQLWRHDMTHFIVATQNYVTSMLQASWAEFQKNLVSAVTLDDLYRTHVNYIKQVIFRCLLKKQTSSIQEALFDICKLILRFHGTLRSATWQVPNNSSGLQHPRFELLGRVYDSFRKLSKFLYRCVKKLAVTGYQAHLNELVQILNMNGFYSDEIRDSVSDSQ